MTLPIRVNADYESELFYGQGGSPQLNQAIEFIAFFLEDRPLLTQKVYPQAYLDYVESITGKRPKTVATGPYENWWGELKDLEKERWLNSKITSAKLIQEEKWCSDTHVIEKSSDLNAVSFDKKYLAKNPYGMSGQRFRVVDQKTDLSPYPVILEPFLNRTQDFSHYVFPDRKMIAYENLVNEKFQYKGTIFNTKTNLTFSSEFYKQLEIIKEYYFQPNSKFGFSIDSFLYTGNGESKIRPLSEVNYRRTMGSVTYDLITRYGKNSEWGMLLLEKSSGNFSALKTKLSKLLLSPNKENGINILSPGNSRFEMFLLIAKDASSGEKLFQELNQLLPQD